VAGCITLITGVATCGNLYLPTGIAIASEDPELELLVADAGDPTATPPLREHQGVIRVFPDRLFAPPIPGPNDPPPSYPAVGEGINDELFCAPGPFATPRSLTIDRSPGHEGTVLVTDSGYSSSQPTVPPRVIRVAASGCNETEGWEVVATGGGMIRPIGIAVADDGTIFVADATADTVFRIDPDTGSVSPLSTPGSIDQAWDLQIQRSHPGPYFVADASVPELLAVDPATPARATVTSGGDLVAPATLEVLPDAAGLLVADPTAQAVTVAALSGAQTIASQAGLLVAPTSASRAVDGTYLVTDLGDPTAEPPVAAAVIRVDPALASPGNQTLVSEGGLLVQPVAGAIDGEGFLIVADAGDGTPANPPRLLRISPSPGLGDAGQWKLFEGPPLVTPAALALDEEGATVVLADRGDATQLPAVLRLVRSVESPGAVLTIIGLASDGLLQTPGGIAIDTDRSILVSDQGEPSQPDDGAVIRVDSLSGLQSQVAIGAATDTLDLPTGIGVRAPSAGIFPDQDGDLIADRDDNCISVANTAQTDTDNDMIGNFCDFDYNNDGVIGAPDFTAVRRAFGSDDANIDADGDGMVGVYEFDRVRGCFGLLPGASGRLAIDPEQAYCDPPQPAP